MPKKAADTDLLSAIRTVSKGRSYVNVELSAGGFQALLGKTSAQQETKKGLELLSPRERQVLGLVAHGHTYREIAEQIGLTVKSVETYRARVAQKLGLRSRAKLVRFALESGLLRPPDAVD